jgi:asparaginyl-tRNA synthetase
MRIQDELLSALRDHLRGNGFIEILAPIIGPVTDPGIRGAQQVSFDYYGTKFKVMSSMILYKQMAVNSFDRVFALSPNIRLEPEETIETGRHLSEFRQLDLEVARASYFDVMEIGEGMVTYVVKRVKANCLDELDVLGRELKTPKLPFKKITCRDAVELLREKGFEVKQGEEIPWNAEAELSRSFGDFFWLIDYPKTARGFYDREDEECPGILRDFDLFYPEGYGEAVSGGEREYKYERVVARMLSTGEVPETYGWYLEMLREGTTPSAGFGIGVERLTRYVCGREYIWESVPFPRVPGVVSP